MARIMLKLSVESAEIRERFGAVSEVIRFCKPSLAFWHRTTRTKATFTAPFIILQQKNFDYDERVGGVRKNIFTLAEDQTEAKSVRDQYALVAYWLKDIFKNDELRKGVTMDSKHGNFFACPKGRTMSLAFKFEYMTKKATHAIFLTQPADYKTLKSKGKWRKGDPDTDPDYPGRISLEANRAVEFKPRRSSDQTPKDYRVWELYSTALTTRVQPNPEKKKTTLHEFPQWYPHGANPPEGKTICFMWERKWAGELDNITTGDTCNREALAEVMIFAATKTYTSHLSKKNKQQRPACETVLCKLLDGVNRGEANSEEAGGLDDLAEEVNSAVANIADRIFG